MKKNQRAFVVLIFGMVSVSEAWAQGDSDTTAPSQRHTPHYSSRSTKPFSENRQRPGVCYLGGQVYSSGFVYKWCARYGPLGCVEMHCIPCRGGAWGSDNVCR
jgi:hypothetical protein